MSTTKRHSVKAVKPQDQTLASKVQELTEAILADQTTELSKPVHWTYKASERYAFGWSDPRSGYGGTHGYGEIRIEGVPVDNKHFSVALTTEQLRAAWLLEYGDRMVSLLTLAENEDMYNIGRQLYARGQLYEEKRFDSYSQYYYLKREHADH